MPSHFPSLLLIPIAVLCSTVITYHNSTQKSVDDVYPGSISHSLLAHLRSRRSPSPFPSPSPECAEGCCGRTHVCGLRGCAFKARCGVDCCPPDIVQDLKLRAQRLTLAAAGVAPEARGPPPHPPPGAHNNNNNQNNNNDNHNRFGPPPMRSYKKGEEGEKRHVVIVHEKQQPMQRGRPQPGHNGHVDRPSERIREPPSPPPMIVNIHPARPNHASPPPPPPPPPTSLPNHPIVDHPHRRGGMMGEGGPMAPHPNTNGPSGLAPSQGAFGPSSRGGFSAAANERRVVENAGNRMQNPPPGRMTFSSKPRNLRPPPGKSMGPKRPPAFTNRPPSVETPMVRPPAFGAATSENDKMPFLSRVKRCCECCMPDCHHGCIRNGGCGMCQALTGSQNNNNSGITRGARTKQHN